MDRRSTQPRDRRRRRAIPIAVAATLLPSGGCGDEDADRAAEAAGLYETVSVYWLAFSDGDGDTAVELLSERCSSAAGLIRTAAEAVGARYDDLAPVGFDAEVEGNGAIVSYTFEDAPELETQGQRWVLEDGRWRYSDC